MTESINLASFKDDLSVIDARIAYLTEALEVLAARRWELTNTIFCNVDAVAREAALAKLTGRPSPDADTIKFLADLMDSYMVKMAERPDYRERNCGREDHA